jgi:hypothetical protein
MRADIHPSRRFVVFCLENRLIGKGFKYQCFWKGYRSAKNPNAPCPQCGGAVTAIDREETDSVFTDAVQS